MGPEGLRHVMMPAAPRPRFIVIHPDFTFAFFDGGLHGPALATLVDQLRFWTRRGGVAQIELQFEGNLYTPTKDEPRARSRQTIAH